MISLNKICPDCGFRVRVFSQDELVDCDNEKCGSTFKVIRDGEDISLRHVPWHKQRPRTETRLDMFADVEHSKCIFCKSVLTIPVRFNHVECACGESFIVSRNQGSFCLVHDIRKTKRIHESVFGVEI